MFLFIYRCDGQLALSVRSWITMPDLLFLHLKRYSYHIILMACFEMCKCDNMLFITNILAGINVVA